MQHHNPKCSSDTFQLNAAQHPKQYLTDVVGQGANKTLPQLLESKSTHTVDGQHFAQLPQRAVFRTSTSSYTRLCW
eukprot:4182516-Amphidinium_carterae.2